MNQKIKKSTSTMQPNLYKFGVYPIQPIKNNKLTDVLSHQKPIYTININKFAKLPSRITVQKKKTQVFSYSLFRDTLKEESVKQRIFSFLDIQTLSRLGSINDGLMNDVKDFVLNYSYEYSTQEAHNQFKKNLSYKYLSQHFNKKFKAQRQIDLITEEELLMLKKEGFKEQQYILKCGLQANGFTIFQTEDIVNIFYQIGMRETFLQMINFSNPKLKTPISALKIPDFKYSSKLSKLMNDLLDLIAETILYRSTYNSNNLYIRSQRIIINELMRDQFANSKNNINEFIQQTQQNRKQPLEKYLNKNNLSLIISYLDIPSIQNLKLTSKKINKLVNHTIESSFLTKYKQELQDKLDDFQLSHQNLEFLLVNAHYLFLTVTIKTLVMDRFVTYEYLNNVVDILEDSKLLYQSLQFNDNKQYMESIFLMQEDIIAEQLKHLMFIESRNSQMNKFTPSTIPQMDIFNSLSEMQITLNSNLQVFPIIILRQFVSHLNPILKQIYIYQKLIDNKQFIPFISTQYLKPILLFRNSKAISREKRQSLVNLQSRDTNPENNLVEFQIQQIN